jgi:hypothetical protein
MTKWQRFVLALWCGLVAYMVAHDLGVPVWRDWDLGDAFDFGVATYCIALCLTIPLARKSA